MAFYVLTPERSRDINFRKRAPLDYVADALVVGGPAVTLHSVVRNIQGKLPDHVYDKRTRLALGAMAAGAVLRTAIDSKYNDIHNDTRNPIRFNPTKVWEEIRNNARATLNDETEDDFKARLSRTVIPPELALYNALVSNQETTKVASPLSLSEKERLEFAQDIRGYYNRKYPQLAYSIPMDLMDPSANNSSSRYYAPNRDTIVKIQDIKPREYKTEIKGKGSLAATTALTAGALIANAKGNKHLALGLAGASFLPPLISPIKLLKTPADSTVYATRKQLLRDSWEEARKKREKFIQATSIPNKYTLRHWRAAHKMMSNDKNLSREDKYAILDKMLYPVTPIPNGSFDIPVASFAPV